MKLIIILLAIFVSFLWGYTPIILKYLLSRFTKTTVIVTEGILYALFLSFFIFWKNHEFINDVKKFTYVDIGLFFLTAIIGGFLANVLYIFLLEENDSYIITALVSISPLFTLILAYLFTKEKITLYGVLGTILIVIGIILISYNDKMFKKEGFLEFL
jgi:drug/metabolite transporter (DMT)-like permease